MTIATFSIFAAVEQLPQSLPWWVGVRCHRVCCILVHAILHLGEKNFFRMYYRSGGAHTLQLQVLKVTCTRCIANLLHSRTFTTLYLEVLGHITRYAVHYIMYIAAKAAAEPQRANTTTCAFRTSSDEEEAWRAGRAWAPGTKRLTRWPSACRRRTPRNRAVNWTDRQQQ